jgi:hypothetical protein
MLDTRGGGGDRVSDSGSFGRGAPMESERSGARAGGSLAEELDDEIPF